MIKKFTKFLLAPLAVFASVLHALWAEAGPQLAVPGFRSNSNYSVLGPTKYIFVSGVSAYRAVQATDAGSSSILGVMQNNPGIDEAMSIACAGPSKVVAGGSITANAIITTNASGRAAAVASGQVACGRALEAAGNDGDVISCMLFHPVRWSGVA